MSASPDDAGPPEAAPGGVHPMDPFAPQRQAGPVWPGVFDGEGMPVILRYRAVREAARDWRRFSSDAPGRVPVPAETDVRTLRQLPIETDPPLHTALKALVMPVFRRPTDPAFAARIAALVEGMLAEALAAGEVEVVGGFALPLQSRALALLLGLPEADAAEWVTWGLHAFKVAGRNVPERAARLEAWIEAAIDRAAAAPGDDLFSHLLAARLDGRPLTREEVKGFAHVTFAGGRDTVIHSLVGAVARLAAHPEEHRRLRESPGLVVTAAEELFRWLSPLTHIGRVCPAGDRVEGLPVAPGGRVALCWAAANFDPAVFEAPTEFRLDRSPNPHVAFGSGDHACLGSAHARLLLRTLLRALAARVERIETVRAVPGVKSIGGVLRPQGFESLTVRLVPAAAPLSSAGRSAPAP